MPNRRHAPVEFIVIPRFSQVALLCSESITGGPEALHQLAYTINRHGGNAQMAYFGGKSRVHLLADRILGEMDPDTPSLPAYAAYEPRPLKEMVFGTDTLLVFPEISVQQAREVSAGNKAVWWLSVDNALNQNPNLRYQSYLDYLFADTSLVHFYQSDYARDFLVSSGARRIHPLFDFTDANFLRPAAETSTRTGRVAYFPRKGGDKAALFVAQSQAAADPLAFAPIENMTKAQVKQTLESCAVYIDFGHHPGKDRVPREAACAGAVVLLHEQGAAKFFADHPLDPDHIFSLADIQSGRLQARVREIIANPQPHLDAQRYYRQKIWMEREEFDLQVKTFFFMP